MAEFIATYPRSILTQIELRDILPLVFQGFSDERSKVHDVRSHMLLKIDILRIHV